MSTALIFLTFVMVTVVLILMLVVFSTTRDTFKSVRSDVEGLHSVVENLRAQGDFHEHAEVPVLDETTEFPAVKERSTIPYDENNPPVRKIYRGVPGRHMCMCHGEPVALNQAVWLWPRPDRKEGAMDIYCDSWMKNPGEIA